MREIKDGVGPGLSTPRAPVAFQTRMTSRFSSSPLRARGERLPGSSS